VSRWLRAAAPALLAAGLVGARGAAETLVLDPARSRVRFTLGATLHTVHGELQLVSGEIRFDPAGGPASGEVVADARSAKTGIGARDRDMHAKVLESGRFPEIRVVASRLEVLRRDATSAEVLLHGILALHGGEHAVAIPARLEARGEEISVEAAFRVPYVEWGLRDVSTFVLRVAKHVDVEVRAVGRLR
jgi:polyisoprenoid-binding protein YceI